MHTNYQFNIHYIRTLPKRVKLNITGFLTFICKQLDIKDIQLDIYLLKNRDIIQLNKRTFNHHYVTDIITLDYSTPDKKQAELYLSTQQIKKQAWQHRKSFNLELQFVLAHGILHILGYNDNTIEKRKNMWQLQERLIKEYQ